jgi:hypothetical protein
MEHMDENQAAKKIQRWYKKNKGNLYINNTDPITLNPITCIPLILQNKKSLKLMKFQPDVLADYFLATGRLENPLTRITLTKNELKKLDNIIKLNKMKPRNIYNQHKKLQQKFKKDQEENQFIQELENYIDLIDLHINGLLEIFNNSNILNKAIEVVVYQELLYLFRVIYINNQKFAVKFLECLIAKNSSMGGLVYSILKDILMNIYKKLCKNQNEHRSLNTVLCIQFLS